MSLYHAFEIALVATAVCGSAYLALARLAPQWLGRKPATSSKACGSCSSCGGGGCGSVSSPPAEQRIDWRR